MHMSIGMHIMFIIMENEDFCITRRLLSLVFLNLKQF